MNQYFIEPFVHQTSKACIVDTTPPVFSGISQTLINSNQSIKAIWPQATDADSGVLGYNVYIKKGSINPSDLFQPENKSFLSYDLDVDVFFDADNNLLTEGYYTLGARAIDNAGNEDYNLQAVSVFTSGVLSQSAGQLASLVSALLRNQQAMQIDVESTEIEIAIESVTIETKIESSPDLNC